MVETKRQEMIARDLVQRNHCRCVIMFRNVIPMLLCILCPVYIIMLDFIFFTFLNYYLL